MAKLPEELSLTEIARLLCGKRRNFKGDSDCVAIMTGFLARVATPFNPKRISGKQHLVAFFRDDPKGYWKQQKLLKPKRGKGVSKHGASVENADKIIVGRDYFLYFINETPKYRYPRIKEFYRNNPFWEKPKP